MASDARSSDLGIPEGMNPNARETWPSPELISSWLGDQDVDFEFRPGEDVVVPDDPEHMAAARRFRDVLGRFASGVTTVSEAALLAALSSSGKECSTLAPVPAPHWQRARFG